MKNNKKATSLTLALPILIASNFLVGCNVSYDYQPSDQNADDTVTICVYRQGDDCDYEMNADVLADEVTLSFPISGHVDVAAQINSLDNPYLTELSPIALIGVSDETGEQVRYEMNKPVLYNLFVNYNNHRELVTYTSTIGWTLPDYQVAFVIPKDSHDELDLSIKHWVNASWVIKVLGVDLSVTSDATVAAASDTKAALGTKADFHYVVYQKLMLDWSEPEFEPEDDGVDVPDDGLDDDPAIDDPIIDDPLAVDVNI